MELLASRAHAPFGIVRAILFDKSPESNWPVSWHQDQTISVAEQSEVEGFNAWSIKQGVPHVRPPHTVLERMITVRLHLDDCSVANGALRVLPGSHRDGLLDDNGIERRTKSVTATVCEVPKGGLLLMKPLLLHASFPSESPGHRRVLHIDYAQDPLPGGLKWFAKAAHEAAA